jgi:hypothetical protein
VVPAVAGKLKKKRGSGAGDNAKPAAKKHAHGDGAKPVETTATDSASPAATPAAVAKTSEWPGGMKEHNHSVMLPPVPIVASVLANKENISPPNNNTMQRPVVKTKSILRRPLSIVSSSSSSPHELDSKHRIS